MGEGTCCAALSMPEPDFSQSVVAHESAFVHISVNAVEMSFTRVLPQDEIEVVFQNRLLRGVLGNHHLVVAQEPQQVVVVEIGTRVKKRFLLVSLLYEIEEREQRVSESLFAQSASRLNVDHGQQILVSRPALGHEVLKLRLLRNLWAVEMVRAHFQPVLVCQVDVLLVLAVDVVASFRGFQVDVCHFAFTHRFPEY